MNKFFTAILLLIILSTSYGVGVYNGLVRQDQTIEAQWAQVETQYQRRYDLIPNLVSTSKAYMTHEEKLFTRLAQARQLYSTAQTVDQKKTAVNEVESALGRLLAVSENYPSLRSNETMLSLMDELSGTENRVATERMRFNEAVRAYNTQVRQIPAKWVAEAFGFGEKAYLKSELAAQASVKVEFN